MKKADYLSASIPVALASLCLVFGLVPGDSRGDEWSATPSLQVKGLYDDNISLRTDSPVSIGGVSVSPLLDLSRRTSTGVLAVGGRLTFDRYSDEDVRDTNTQLLTLNAYTGTRRGKLGLRGSYKRDTIIRTVTASLDDESGDSSGIGGSDDDIDANIVTAEVKRGRLNLRPYWSYTLSELTRFQLGYTVNNTTYTDDAGTSLSDYRRHQMLLTLTHKLGRSNAVSAGVGAGRYKAVDKGIESDDYSLNAGWTHDFTPLTRGELSFGLRSVTSSDGDVEIESSGALFGARLTSKYSETDRYEFNLSRDLYPSGAGTLVLSDFLRASYSRNLSSRLTGSLWLTAFKNQSADFFSSSINRTHYEIEPALRWMAGKFWSIDASYRFRWQKYEDETESAESNAVFLAMSYAWPKMAVSR